MNPRRSPSPVRIAGTGSPKVPDAYSTVCRKCGQHFRVQVALHPTAKRAEAPRDTKEVVCFQCGTVLQVAREAESTMCKRCSTHVDLRDYRIDHAVSKNFRTHGAFVIEEKGYVFNTEVDAGRRGDQGPLPRQDHRAPHAHHLFERRLSRHLPGGATGHSRGNHFRWPTPLHLGGADLAANSPPRCRPTTPCTCAAPAACSATW